MAMAYRNWRLFANQNQHIKGWVTGGGGNSSPNFFATAITHREDAVYPAAIVGMPPMEDFYIGGASVKLFLPIFKMNFPEIVDIALPAEGVFHNLVFVSIKEDLPDAIYKFMLARMAARTICCIWAKWSAAASGIKTLLAFQRRSAETPLRIHSSAWLKISPVCSRVFNFWPAFT
jgi:hypothetical protein